MKNFSIEIYEKALSKLRLSDYEKFSVQQSLLWLNLNFFFDVVNKVVPTKTIRIKNNTNEWLDGDIAEKITTWDKLFRKF